VPNEVIHFDYLYMSPSEAGFKYLLLIKDELSRYLWLVLSEAADAAATVDALTLWFAAFGVSQVWVSDQGSHFKNQVIDFCSKGLVFAAPLYDYILSVGQRNHLEGLSRSSTRCPRTPL
jgi:hypothetical protein